MNVGYRGDADASRRNRGRRWCSRRLSAGGGCAEEDYREAEGNDMPR